MTAGAVGYTTELNERFQRAAAYLASNASAVPDMDLLFFYSRYKQAVVGPCTEPSPGPFGFRKRSKWEAWRSLGHMPKEKAMQQYINKVNETFPGWSAKPVSDKPKKASYGPVISTFLNTEPELDDFSKTPFDWVKEGNVEQLRKCLRASQKIIFLRDSNGLGLLHWACDRGHYEVAALLIAYGIEIDYRDKDGQTPLHYACSCGHEEIVALLLRNAASIDLPDSDGQLPQDVAFTAAIKQLVLVKKE